MAKASTSARLLGTFRGASCAFLLSAWGCGSTPSTPAASVLTEEAQMHEAPEQAEPSFLERLQQEGWRIAEGKDGHFHVAWRSLTGKVPRNRAFDMELYVLADGTALSGAQVRVRGWMPDHGHGLNLRPAVREVEAARYLVEGMVLHMRGHWQIFFDVVSENVGDIVEFEERL